MYQKAKVEASEKEHIAAPASTMLADAWIPSGKKTRQRCSIIYFDRNYPACQFLHRSSVNIHLETLIITMYMDFPSAAHNFLVLTSLDVTCWVRTWMGTRISLMIALVAAILDLVVGVLYGAVSALFGGKGRRCYAAYY